MKWPQATEEENDENVAPEPYIVTSKNPYAALGEAMEAEEAAEAEAARVAAAEAEAAKNRMVALVAPVASVASAAVSVVVAGGTPVARRTRHAFNYVSETMTGVVAAVANSPMIKRSRTVVENVLKPTQSEAPKPVEAPKRAVPKAAPKAAPKAVPKPAADNAPRRSSRLRPTGA